MDNPIVDKLKSLFPHLFGGNPATDMSSKTSSLSDEKINKIKMDVSLKSNDAYFKTLGASGTMTANAKKILADMNEDGITSPFSQAGILAVISKESNFVPVRENLNYNANALVNVFSVPADTAKKLTALSGIDKQKAIADTVYMPPHNTQLGNTQQGDGYFFRGWSWNQLTGRAIILKYASRAGADVIAHPELMDDIDVMTKATLEYFKDGIAQLKKITIKVPATAVSPFAGQTVNRMMFYNNPTGDINGFKNELDAAAAFYNINAGAGQSYDFLMKDVTGGRALTMARASGFVNWIKENS